MVHELADKLKQRMKSAHYSYVNGNAADSRAIRTRLKFPAKPRDVSRAET